MTEINKGDLVYVPILNGNHYKVLHVFTFCGDGDSIVIKKDDGLLCTFSNKDYFKVNQYNYKIIIDVFDIEPEPPPPNETLYNEDDMLYVPRLGTGIYHVCCIIGESCYVSYYCTQERDDVLFIVDEFNSHKANRDNRILLDELYKKTFSPTIYDGENIKLIQG